MLGRNFNTQGCNLSEYVWISCSGALVQLLLLGVEQAGINVLFLGEREKDEYNSTILLFNCIAQVAIYIYK